MVISRESITVAILLFRLFVHDPFVVVRHQQHLSHVERVLVAVDRIQLVQGGDPTGDEASRQAADIGEVR